MKASAQPKNPLTALVGSTTRILEDQAPPILIAWGQRSEAGCCRDMVIRIIKASTPLLLLVVMAGTRSLQADSLPPLYDRCQKMVQDLGGSRTKIEAAIQVLDNEITLLRANLKDEVKNLTPRRDFHQRRTAALGVTSLVAIPYFLWVAFKGSGLENGSPVKFLFGIGGTFLFMALLERGIGFFQIGSGRVKEFSTLQAQVVEKTYIRDFLRHELERAQ